MRIVGRVQDNMTGHINGLEATLTVTNSCDRRPVPSPHIHTLNLCCVHEREMGKPQALHVGWWRAKKDPAASQSTLKEWTLVSQG